MNLDKPMAFFLFFILLTHFVCSSYPDSKPFISGDTFRSIADHIYDETTSTFDVQRVTPGDIIFVNLSHLDDFFSKVHPQLNAPYILISHNHDYSAPGNHRHILDDEKLIAWFTQNPDLVGHSKLIPIPIGLSNRRYHLHKEPDKILQQVLQNIPNSSEKTYLLYVNFNVHTAPTVRQPVYDFFTRLSFCSWASNRLYKEFLIDLSRAKFVLSPHGNGLDAHRTWEALYMGSFPLVKTSSLDPLYEDLPVLIVNDWSEISVEFLERKYFELRQGSYKKEKLYFDFWYQKIKKTQSNYKNQLLVKK